MERVIRQNNFGDIACNDTIIYSKDKSEIGRGLVGIYYNWAIIEPKYYLYKDDNCLIEIWNDDEGILLDNGFNKFLVIGEVAPNWSNKNREEISYKEAMEILEQKNKKTNNFASNMVDEVEFYNREEIKDRIVKQNNNGGATDYYALPENANTLQDLIEHRNMNGSVKDIFKACYRLGIKTEDELRDLNKMAYYSLREIGRITARKDYITIAKELMGSQAMEKE